MWMCEWVGIFFLKVATINRLFLLRNFFYYFSFLFRFASFSHLGWGWNVNALHFMRYWLRHFHFHFRWLFSCRENHVSKPYFPSSKVFDEFEKSLEHINTNKIIWIFTYNLFRCNKQYSNTVSSRTHQEKEKERMLGPFYQMHGTRDDDIKLYISFNAFFRSSGSEVCIYPKKALLCANERWTMRERKKSENEWNKWHKIIKNNVNHKKRLYSFKIFKPTHSVYIHGPMDSRDVKCF